MMKMMQERREKQKAREEACDERMQKILDASQYKKWLKQKQNEQNRGRMGQGGEGRFGGGGRPMGGLNSSVQSSQGIPYSIQGSNGN